ncbi:MAG: hypothetical protein JO320_24495 [Alphaproteobacteria bacterium]|nr:hypothetical protein [Alphaproteobacteria bacterium]MBV9198849.1 hypothetical protein [Alphaproteobacteria bacterium]MBV9378164.1 hypothetical protein [Alphaproteobacteria bacterium]
MEQALGALINAMNPYSNPTCDHIDQAAGRMQAVFAGVQLPQGTRSEKAQPVAELGVQIDNYQGGEWSFMGQMYKIKRSLLVPYRYEVRNKDGKGSGVCAIGNLLIGYTGANGG